VGCVFFHRYTKFYTHITHIRNNIHILNNRSKLKVKNAKKWHCRFNLGVL
jgi:hypothetical protein